MNPLLQRTLFVVILAHTAISGYADETIDPAEQRYKKFTASTPVSKDEKEKILFYATIPENVSPRGISYQLQNGLSDSVIVGVILAVTYKDANSGKEQTIELYEDCSDTLPLSSTEGHVPFFQAEEISKLKPTISLKEVRIRKI